MKSTKTNVLFLILFIMVALIFTLAAYAAAPAEGYTLNDEGQATNIKWTLEENGTLTFAIDAEATDKVSTTVISNKDPLTGSVANYNTCLPTYSEAVKIVIGDGITEIYGFSYIKGLEQVELAPSVEILGNNCFQTNGALKSVYIRDNEPIEGTIDLSNITALGKYTFDGCTSVTNVILSAKYSGTLPLECLKNLKIKALTIPETVTSIEKGALSRSNYLEELTILGENTVISSEDVFSKNVSFPKIKAKAGSRAAEFAIAKGYTFIDLDTGAETKGTKPVTDAAKVESGEGIKLITEFKPEGATAYGHLSGEYNGKTTIDTYWAYYRDTKTLEFLSGTTAYNETGTIANADAGFKTWAEYEDEIEHIIIGDYIKKVSKDSFTGYEALKDVRLGKNVNDIGQRTFFNCTNLEAIWRDGTERKEGQADLTNLKEVRNIFKNNKIVDVILPKSTVEITVDLLPGIKNLYAYQITDALIEYSKTYYYNLINIQNPTERYDFWFYIDPSLPACGLKSVYSFDEATGVLTISGAGAIDSIVNYYGGGSRNQPWRSFRHQVKHIVIGEGITSVGKYAFCEFGNLETVELPNTESFEILNAAFEKCYNLRSVYRNGEEPIEGTLDLRNVHTIYSWSFAYTYLIANVVISPEVGEIGTSVFEENITLNLKNVYGTPGSFAETYAQENGLTFYDISANTPAPITCTPPETTAEPEDTTALESEEATAYESETDDPYPFVSFYEILEGDEPVISDGAAENQNENLFPIIIIAASGAVLAAALIVIVLAVRKKKRKA